MEGPEQRAGTEPTYLTLTQACEQFDVSESTLRRLVRDHGLQRYRKVTGDNRRYVRKGDLERLLAMVPEGDPREAERGLAPLARYEDSPPG